VIATPQGPHELTATVLWLVDGATARPLVRIPRGGYEAKPLVRLARRSDGRAIGVVTDGQSAWDRWGTMRRWILPIDLESLTPGEPELLGPTDLADRKVTACATPHASGAITLRPTSWILDVPLNTSARVHIGGAVAGGVSSIMGRLRLTPDDACIEQLTGNFDLYGAHPEMLTRRGASADRSAAAMTVSVFATHTRYPLRCTPRR
jgi:hypothetical protein